MPVTTTLVVGGAVQAGAAVAKFLHHNSDLKSANEEEARLATPFYKVQKEYYQNRDLAADAASRGYNSATRDYLTSETGRGLSGSISAIQQGGGDPNQVAKLFEIYQEGINKTAAQDAQLRTESLKQFMDRNTAVAGQKNVQFAINELQPYERKLKQLQERKKADIEGRIGAVSDFGNVLSSTATAFQNAENGKTPETPPAGASNTASQGASFTTPTDYLNARSNPLFTD